MSRTEVRKPAARRLRSERIVAAGMRARLRLATAAAHERMHGHAGFAAAAAGVIGFEDYRRLLARLLGFHMPFEIVAREAAAALGCAFDVAGRARSPSLLADLASLGLDRQAIARLPRWVPRRGLTSAAALLGALYVLEGSTLGGVQIARALGERMGGETGEGRRFFLGRGDRNGVMWAEFVERLEAVSADLEAAGQAIDAAVATFEEFETWMAGWRADIGPAGRPSAEYGLSHQQM